METQEKTTLGNSVSELTTAINTVINNIEEMILLKPEVYSINGNLNVIKEELWKIKDLGICGRRRLKRFLNKCLYNNNLNSYNTLLHYLCKHVCKSTERIKITSPKHELIQKKRKEWIEARNKAEELLKSYNLEKSDFYKVNTKI
ncbi:hypothetical protein M0Q50_01890 [bacterium]|jgi:hypothetical protein|nr:hypothetical protein [bacterium]